MSIETNDIRHKNVFKPTQHIWNQHGRMSSTDTQAQESVLEHMNCNLVLTVKLLLHHLCHTLLPQRVTHLPKIPTSHSEPMLCHLLSQATKMLNQINGKSPKKKKKKGQKRSDQESQLWREVDIPACLSSALSSASGAPWPERQDRIRRMQQRRERGEGKRDTANEREIDWGQSTTGQGKPKVGSHNALWDRGWTQINTETLFRATPACNRTERRAIARWKTETKKGISARDQHTVITRDGSGDDVTSRRL